MLICVRKLAMLSPLAPFSSLIMGHVDCSGSKYKNLFLTSSLSDTFSEENRSTCKLVGGSPAQELGECLGNGASYCDTFYQENCEYQGADLGLSPPDGEIGNEMECQSIVEYSRCVKLLFKLDGNILIKYIYIKGFWMFILDI